jgi:hypothetical protein
VNCYQLFGLFVLLFIEYYCFSYLFRHLRPELVRKWRSPLNPDAFSDFILKDTPENREKHEKEIFEVSFSILIQFDHISIPNICVVYSALNS